MKEQGGSVATVILVAVALSFSACNRGPAIKPVQAAAGPAQPSPAQRPQTSVAAQATPPLPTSPAASSSLPSVPDAAPKSDGPAPKVVVSERSQNLVVAQQTFRLLTHVQSIPATSEETVEWWELRDAKEQVLYREAYGVEFENGSFANTVAINASSFTTKQGSGILIQGMDLPSAPDSGGWLRVFGFKYGRDKYGADESLFGPYGPPISIEGEFLDVDTDPLQPTPTSFQGTTTTVMRDILKFRLWTGNVNIVYPVLINWITGTLQPAWRCLETTSKGRVERCSYPITVDAHRDATEPTFVRLFPEADDGYTPKHVVVQAQSKIDYLEARVPVSWNEDANAISFSVNGDVWIKVRIDGVEGWIHSQEDFDAVGLPQSG